MHPIRRWLPACLALLLLSACGSGGSAGDVPVIAPPAAVPTIQLQALPTEIETGLSAVLSWTSTNAESCTASGGWSGSRAPGGHESVSPPEGRTVYRLQCRGPGGEAAASVEIRAVPPEPADLEFRRLRALELGCCNSNSH